MEHDMTSGNITRQIFLFSLPIVMGNIFQQLYNTADAIIVGQMIGKDAFAAVSVANPIMSVVLFFLVGLSMGVGILLAQKYGAKDLDTFRRQYSTALIAGVLFTLISALLCILCSRWMLKAANTPVEILDITDHYLKIIFVGMFFSFLYNYFASALRAIGDSRASFIFLWSIFCWILYLLHKLRLGSSELPLPPYCPRLFLLPSVSSISTAPARLWHLGFTNLYSYQVN